MICTDRYERLMPFSARSRGPPRWSAPRPHVEALAHAGKLRIHSDPTVVVAQQPERELVGTAGVWMR